MTIREYESADCERILSLYYDTVHTVNAPDYTKEQLDAWADGAPDAAEWDRTLSVHFSLVAEENCDIVGFGDIDGTGYLDRLYVHQDHQRRGIATALCDRLESAFKAETIRVHSSITAKPFFTARGYSVVKKQLVIRKGIKLTNFVMEKRCAGFFHQSEPDNSL